MNMEFNKLTEVAAANDLKICSISQIYFDW